MEGGKLLISAKGFFLFEVGKELIAGFEGLNEDVLEAEILGVVHGNLIFSVG